MPGAWRLLDTGAGEGAWNMAVDEAVLEAHREGRVPPTVRFYDWSWPTLSLGYAQRLDGLDLPALAAADVALVRRPTGGRAVLHANDFTYAVVASGLPAGVAASYRAIAAALVAALRALGLAAAIEAGSAKPGRSPSCFAAATQADLLLAGRKAVGSAQVRRAGAVLQHGTIYLTPPPAGLLPDEPDLVDLASLMGAPPTRAELATVMAQAFADVFGVELRPGVLSPWEAARAAANAANFKIQST